MNTILKSALLVAAGILIGMGIARDVVPAAAAQQREGGGRRAALPTMDQLPAEVAQLKALVPSNSHIMMDVQWHWTNLWWAGKKKNWPLAQYYFNETRGHIQWFVKKSPTLRSAGPDREEVNIEGIF